MESAAAIRKVDELGRIVLPADIRRMLRIEIRDELEIYAEHDRIIIKKFEPSCIFCGSARELISYHGKNICQRCLENLRQHG